MVQPTNASSWPRCPSKISKRTCAPSQERILKQRSSARRVESDAGAQSREAGTSAKAKAALRVPKARLGAMTKRDIF